ncbi:MAG: HAD family phosphatase [Planctomycetota bacterium]
MPIHAIVFDFDGVLADSERAHAETIRAVAAEHGMPFSSETYENQLIGFDDTGAFDAVQRLAGQDPDPALTRSMAELKTERFEDLVRSGAVGLYEGAADFVRRTAERVPVAICSGAAGNEIRMMIEAAGIAGLFTAVVSADDVEHSKPDPACYRLACDALGKPPADCLAIEDTVVGLTAARSAGLRVAGVGTSSPRATLEPLEAFAPTLTGFDPNELLALDPLQDGAANPQRT